MICESGLPWFGGSFRLMDSIACVCPIIALRAAWLEVVPIFQTGARRCQDCPLIKPPLPAQGQHGPRLVFAHQAPCEAAGKLK